MSSTTRSASGQQPLVVGGDDDDPTGLRQPAHQLEHPVDLHEVEVGGGLVGEDQRRVVHQRPGDRHPLLLAAGEVAGEVVDPVGEVDGAEQLEGAGLRLLRPSRRLPTAAPPRSPTR